MSTGSKAAQVALAVALPTSVLLLYWWYIRSSQDEDAYGKQRVVTSRQTRIEMWVPKKSVGAIIGKQGSVIKEIQKASGARVKFNDRAGEEEKEKDGQRMLFIIGTVEAAQQAELMIHQLIADIPEVLEEEIQVPHYAIGRIIGKGGKSIRQMCTSSGAKINIDRAEDLKEPDQLRVVSLKGSRAQIDAALHLIEERLEEEEEFRAKLSVSAANRDQRPHQGRQHTREPVKLKSVPAESDTWDYSASNGIRSGQDQLPSMKNYFEVFVSAVENPAHFWVQAVGTKALQLEEIQNEMTAFASTTEAKENYRVREVVPGQLVSARFDPSDSVYYRARVLGATDDGRLDLYFVDFGDNAFVDMAEVFVLRSDFASFPFQAIECQLADVEPSGGEWNDEGITLFEDLSFCGQWKVLLCRVTGYRDDMTPLVHLCQTGEEQGVDIGAALVERGFAVKTPDKGSNTGTATVHNSQALRSGSTQSTNSDSLKQSI